MSEDFWRGVLAAKTFNSPAGQGMLADAKKKLPMDAKLPLELVGEVTALLPARVLASGGPEGSPHSGRTAGTAVASRSTHLIQQAPYAFWATTKKARDEHIETMVAQLKGARPVQATLLVESYASGGNDGFRHAGAWLANLERNSHLPGALKSLPKKWVELEMSKLSGAAARTVAAHLKTEPGTSDILPFWGLCYVVRRAEPEAKALVELEKAITQWADGSVWERVKAAADR